jgi:hypothetical protein
MASLFLHEMQPKMKKYEGGTRAQTSTGGMGP